MRVNTNSTSGTSSKKEKRKEKKDAPQWHPISQAPELPVLRLSVAGHQIIPRSILHIFMYNYLYHQRSVECKKLVLSISRNAALTLITAPCPSHHRLGKSWGAQHACLCSCEFQPSTVTWKTPLSDFFPFFIQIPIGGTLLCDTDWCPLVSVVIWIIFLLSCSFC